MPLYKLTSKRATKRQREEESGLADIKAAMRGEMGGEDSESGESDSEDSDESEGEDSVPDSGDEDDEDEDESGGEGSGSSSSGSDSSDSNDEDQDIPVSLDQALSQPIYEYIPEDLSDDEDDPSTLRACVLCPGKTLKSDEMVDIHLKSNNHQRSLKRYSARLALHTSGEKPLETKDPREVVEYLLERMDDKVSKSGSQRRKARGSRLKLRTSDNGLAKGGDEAASSTVPGGEGKKRKREDGKHEGTAKDTTSSSVEGKKAGENRKERRVREREEKAANSAKNGTEGVSSKSKHPEEFDVGPSKEKIEEKKQNKPKKTKEEKTDNGTPPDVIEIQAGGERPVDSSVVGEVKKEAGSRKKSKSKEGKAKPKEEIVVEATQKAKDKPSKRPKTAS